ncbi:hypothetical protein BRAS3843_1730035 [Bradyrhizobium sp. STM 3843]|nr:hypothetical protein BRAS3843_1730035 [Bradyrhizobium sp. STM 3843]
MQMRKRGPDGRWIYRDATDAESLDQISREAW